MLDKIWSPIVLHTKKLLYHTILDCTYWNVFGSFNKRNVIKFTDKITSGEEYDDMNKIVFNGIIENMVSLVKTSKYGTMNTTYKNGYYDTKYVSEAFKLQ